MKSLAFLSVTSLLLFASCSDENDVVPAASEDGSVSFDLSVVNNPEQGSISRSYIYSQEAVQHVSDVSIIAYKKTGADYIYETTFSISGWADGTSFMRYAVPAERNLPTGDYKFLALGVASDNQFTLTTPSNPSTNKFEDMAAEITNTGMETELFAGNTPYTIIAKGSRVSIMLTRKVAGVLGYFKNVPTTVDGDSVKFLRLSVSAANRKVNLSTGQGSNPGNSFNIIDINLENQTMANDVYQGNTVPLDVVKLPNSQLHGAYLTPVNGTTMTLGLYNKSGAPLRTWNVVSTDGPMFNILPNHFYTLGKKMARNSTVGDPGNPADDDAPIDLLTDQTISITISPNWTDIHDLVIQNPVSPVN